MEGEQVSRFTIRSRWVLAIAGIACVSVVIAGCNSSGGGSNASGNTSAAGNSSSSNPYRILYLGALSGPVGPSGKMELEGVQALADKMNKSGGIMGRQIVVTSQDTGANAQTAVTDFQAAVDGGNEPDLVFAGTTSEETLALCPLIARAGLIGVSISGDVRVGESSVCPNSFSGSVDPAHMLEGMAAYMKTRGWKKVAIIADSAAYPNSVSQAAQTVFPSEGFQIVGTQSFDPSAVDTTPQWKHLKGSGADVVLVEGNGADVGPELDGRVNVGWNVPTILGPGASISNPATLVRSQAALKGATMWIETSALAGVDLTGRLNAALPFLNALTRGKYTVARNQAVNSWDIAAAVLTAIADTKSFDTKTLISYMDMWAAKAPSNPLWVGRPRFDFTSQYHFGGSFEVDGPAQATALAPDGTYMPVASDS